MNSNANRNSTPIPHDLLDSLFRSRAITQFQANWIAATWETLDSDAFAHPYLRDISEHSRAVLERRRVRSAERVGFEPTRRVNPAHAISSRAP
jgi:hypothetical protein